MRASIRLSRTGILILVGLGTTLHAGCTLGRVTERNGQEGYSRTASVSMNRDQALLDRGRQARTEGRWDEAVDSFTTVSENASAQSEHRQEALYELGVVYSDLLNPGKDFGKAIKYFERLVSEHPDSTLHEKAEGQMERLRSLQGEPKN